MEIQDDKPMDVRHTSCSDKPKGLCPAIIGRATYRLKSSTLGPQDSAKLGAQSLDFLLISIAM